MIKLELPPRPRKLTKKLQSDLVAKYKSDRSPVWNQKFIKEALLTMSFNKCCYSECNLTMESRYMEVEHYYPKELFPEKVVEWGNLLPCCKKCNTTKGRLDTLTTPIINPLKDNPKDHLYIRGYRYLSKSPLGRQTIDFTGINDHQHFAMKRFDIGNKIIENLEEIKITLEEISSPHPNLQLQRLLNRIKRLLNEGTRCNEYSATISTIILSDECFLYIEDCLKRENLWDTEMQELVEELKYCSLLEDR